MNLLGNWFTKRLATCQHRSNPLRMKQPDARPARRFAFRPSLELLEDRLAPTANIAITHALVVDGNDHPLSVLTAGESVFIQADFTTRDLPSNASYRVSFTVNGQTLDSSYVTWVPAARGQGLGISIGARFSPRRARTRSRPPPIRTTMSTRRVTPTEPRASPSIRRRPRSP